MDDIKFEIDVGMLRTTTAALIMKVEVENGRARVMVYVMPSGRGSGGLVMLGGTEYTAFREMVAKTDAIVGGAATGGRPLLLGR